MNKDNDNSALKSSLARSLLKIKAMEQRQAIAEAQEQNLVYLASKRTLKTPKKAVVAQPILKAQTLILEQTEHPDSLKSAHKKSIERAAALLKKTTQEGSLTTPSELASAALNLKATAPLDSNSPSDPNETLKTITSGDSSSGILELNAAQDVVEDASAGAKSLDSLETITVPDVIENASAGAQNQGSLELNAAQGVIEDASADAQNQGSLELNAAQDVVEDASAGAKSLDSLETITVQDVVENTATHAKGPKSLGASTSALNKSQSSSVSIVKNKGKKAASAAKLKITASGAKLNAVDSLLAADLLSTGSQVYLEDGKSLQVDHSQERENPAPSSLAINGQIYNCSPTNKIKLWELSDPSSQTLTLEDFYERYGQSSESIALKVAPLITQILEQENLYLGARSYYQLNLNQDELIVLEQNLFGAKLNANVDKQLCLLQLLIIVLSHNTNTNDYRSSPYFITRNNIVLRRIVFNNPMVERIASSNRSENEKWRAWKEEFENFNSNIKTKEYFTLTEAHFNLLKRAFSTFNNFAKAIALLNSWAIVLPKAKSWEERYLFPCGAETLLSTPSDYSVSGQLLFTMLTRAPSTKALELLQERFLENHDAFNVFAQLLGNSFGSEEDKQIALLRGGHISPQELPPSVSLASCNFVPYLSLKCFECLEQDFRHLLSLNLTKVQLFQSLSTLGMLHLLVYFMEQEQRLSLINNISADKLEQLNQGQHNISDACSIDMVVSMGSKTSPSITKLSQSRLMSNSKLHKSALRNFIANTITLLVRSCAPFLQKDEGLKPKEQEILCDLVRALFAFAPNKALLIDLSAKGSIDLKDKATVSSINKNYQAAHNNYNILRTKAPYPNYQSMLNLLTEALLTQSGELENIHRTLAFQAGLIYGTTKANQHYGFSDELLYSLVLTCVDQKRSMIMLSEFLQKLYERYHLVIGPAQARQYFATQAHGRSIHIEEKEFENNLQELIAQLKRMDLLINLSDACEYVINPFALRS